MLSFCFFLICMIVVYEMHKTYDTVLKAVITHYNINQC